MKIPRCNTKKKWIEWWQNCAEAVTSWWCVGQEQSALVNDYGDSISLRGIASCGEAKRGGKRTVVNDGLPNAVRVLETPPLLVRFSCIAQKNCMCINMQKYATYNFFLSNVNHSTNAVHPFYCSWVVSFPVLKTRWLNNPICFWAHAQNMKQSNRPVMSVSAGTIGLLLSIQQR